VSGGEVAQAVRHGRVHTASPAAAASTSIGQLHRPDGHADGNYNIAGSDLQRWTTVVSRARRARDRAIRNMVPTGGQSINPLSQMSQFLHKQ
jgi:hypothetical protein